MEMTGLRAEIENDAVKIKWDWDKTVRKVKITGDWEVGSEKEYFSEDVYWDQYIADGNQFVYKISPSDPAILTFRLEPYVYQNGSSGPLVAIEATGNQVEVMGRPQEIRFSFQEEKGFMSFLDEYRGVYIHITAKPNVKIKKDALYYKKSRKGYLYGFPLDLRQGSGRYGPVILKKGETLGLFVAEAYKGLFRLKEE